MLLVCLSGCSKMVLLTPFPSLWGSISSLICEVSVVVGYKSISPGSPALRRPYEPILGTGPRPRSRKSQGQHGMRPRPLWDDPTQ